MGISRRAFESDTYIPHPAPNAKGSEDEPKMGLLSILKTLIIPALISLILYLLISYVVVPIWKRYRSRYSQYLPLDTISTQTTSFRQKLQNAVVQYLLPSSWRRDFGRDRAAMNSQDVSGSDFDEEEGEELYEVDDNRREALSLDARRGRDNEGLRLSRDLEEGFKDDSDDEDDLLGERQGRT